MKTKFKSKPHTGDNRRFMLSAYEHERDILSVSRAVRERGLKIVDVYSPYAVHGLEDAMGLQPSRIPWICFALAIIGAIGKVWFEYWTTWLNWPINVGGKPWDSLPAFIPVTFEVMVLCAGISTVLALFYVRRMYPGRKADIPMSGVTDDRFVLVIEEENAAFEKQEIMDLLYQHNAVQIEERVHTAGAGGGGKSL